MAATSLSIRPKSGFHPGALAHRDDTRRHEGAVFGNLLLAVLLGLGGSAGCQAEDVTPPELTAFSCPPAVTAPATVWFNFTATDDLSGVKSIQLGFLTPAGIQAGGPGASFSPASLTLTNSVGATFTSTSPAGLWTVDYVQVCDAANNCRRVVTSALAALGFTTQFTLVISGDVTPPTLTGLQFAPALDTTGGAATLTVSFSATDDSSGVRSFAVWLVSPSGTRVWNGVASVASAPTVTGSAAVTFPQCGEAGTWRVGEVSLCDVADNCRRLSTQNLAEAGFATELTVIPARDVIPPSLTGLSFPPLVNLASGTATLWVTYSATDDVCGVQMAEVRLLSPSGTRWIAAGAYYSYFAARPAITDQLGLTLTASCVETGTWQIQHLKLCDAADNCQLFLTPELGSLGFLTQVKVVKELPVQIDIKPGSYPNSINLGSQGTIPVAILSTPDFDARKVDPTTVSLAGATIQLRGKGTPMTSLGDVNGDGLPDLAVHILTEALQLSATDTEAVLTGQTVDGLYIRGTDSVRIVP